jgi:phosphoglycolate phosphatase
MIALVVFDLDGTLVDSHHDLADATNALLTELGAAPLAHEAVARMVGDGAAVLIKRALLAAGRDPDTPGALDRFLALYDERLLATTRPYPGMTDAIEALRPAHRLAVLTNKPARATKRVLEGLDLLGSFDDVIGGDSEYGRKPDPAGLLALVSRAHATPATTLMVGDSPVDLATARRAGTLICLARYGFGFGFEGDGFRGDEYFVDTPSDLRGVVNRASRGNGEN